jgi:hypothetical protein
MQHVPQIGLGVSPILWIWLLKQQLPVINDTKIWSLYLDLSAGIQASRPIDEKVFCSSTLSYFAEQRKLIRASTVPLHKIWVRFPVSPIHQLLRCHQHHSVKSCMTIGPAVKLYYQNTHRKTKPLTAQKKWYVRQAFETIDRIVSTFCRNRFSHLSQPINYIFYATVQIDCDKRLYTRLKCYWTFDASIWIILCWVFLVV